MIKIEFNSVKPMLCRITNTLCMGYNFYTEYPKPLPNRIFDVKSVTFGRPSELVPSRDEVLKQLGISKEHDEEMQQKYK